MNASHIDHVNIQIPPDRVDEAVEFYRDDLGFELEEFAAYQAGDRPLFSVRLGETCLIHIRPIEAFQEPTDQNYDHFAIVVQDSIKEVKKRLAAAGIEVQRESTPLGATGRAPAVYIQDPFGYTLEIKTTVSPT